ncbi:MFS transporter [Nonomuraea pusilla]|uniref:Predicted arabinose efflux permease, MFS family n=1 Tax=Nonomuraea pusilla TaxID=46177 RepID=A0A1H7NX81_9ACTN|nr:MFS transporter [Nonomuraea pusilla]SEL28210.1 Predicted arabinose efflux permease, MFS family [Nonomuraea pusilla]
MNEATAARPLRQVLSEHRLSLYPVSALGVLVISNSFADSGLTVLAPELRTGLGLSVADLAGAMSVQFLALAVAPLALAGLAASRPRRAVLSVVTGLVWSAATAALALTTGLWSLALVLLVIGVANGSTVSLHTPLLVDTYPSAVRARMLTLYGAASALAYVLAPLAVSALTGWLGLGWRAVFAVVGGASALMCLYASGLRDPGVGRHDEPGADTPAGLLPAVRAMAGTPTVRRVVLGFAAFGALQVPVSTLVSVHLEERWQLDAGARGVFFTCAAVIMLAALLASGRPLDQAFQARPGRVAAICGGVVMVTALGYAAGMLAPALPLALGAFLLAAGAQALIVPATQLICLTVVAPAHRAHAAAVSAIAIAAGGMLGAALLGAVQDSLGAAGAVVAIAVPGLVAAAVVASAGRTLGRDLATAATP